VPAGRFPVNSGGQPVTKYTYAQLEGLWINAGGSPATAPVAAAIAEAESGGFPGATSGNPDGGTNVGLWQLDTRGKGAGKTVAQLKDPATNAKMAVQGSNGGKDWSAWETFANGAYKAFLSGKTQPNLNVPGGAADTSASGTGTAQTSTCLIAMPSILFSGGGCVFSKTNARALIGGLMLAAGGVVGFVGLGVLVAGAFSQTKAGQAAGKAVGSTAEFAGAGVSFIPGAEAAGAGIAAAGKGAKSYSGHVQRRRAAAATGETRMRRQLGEPRENPELRTGRGAVRETSGGTRRRQVESGRDRARRMANPDKVPF
jgi:Lysozyme like domain